MQIVRFRGVSPEEVALEVHAELPLEAMSRGLDLREGEVETGVFLLDTERIEIARQVDARVLTYGDATATNALRSWRFRLRETIDVTAAVEALDPVTRRAAVARDSVRVEPFAEGVLGISDLLLADAIRPLAREPARRDELDIIPNPARRYAKSQPVHVYWEIYGLQADDAGFAARRDIGGAGAGPELRGHDPGRREQPAADPGGAGRRLGVQRGGRRPNWSCSTVARASSGARDRAIEYLRLDLADAPPGEYEIRLQVQDARTKARSVRGRRFVVVKE